MQNFTSIIHSIFHLFSTFSVLYSLLPLISFIRTSFPSARSEDLLAPNSLFLSKNEFSLFIMDIELKMTIIFSQHIEAIIIVSWFLLVLMTSKLSVIPLRHSVFPSHCSEDSLFVFNVLQHHGDKYIYPAWDPLDFLILWVDVFHHSWKFSAFISSDFAFDPSSFSFLFGTLVRCLLKFLVYLPCLYFLFHIFSFFVFLCCIIEIFFSLVLQFTHSFHTWVPLFLEVLFGSFSKLLDHLFYSFFYLYIFSCMDFI